MATHDPFQHFVQAQAGAYDRACAELTAGEKQTHWMWFIFPQLAGLGRSSMAQRYSLATLAQAQDYLQHPLLGPRLQTAVRIVNDLRGRSVDQIFGYPDNLKFHSCVTLFALATERQAAQDVVFRTAMQRYFAGRMDQATMKLLAQ